MIILRGCPIVVQLDGVRECVDREVDTETRLYWEQQLDLGDAVIVPLSELCDWEGGITSGHGYTHRLTSETGGVFHVEATEGNRTLERVALPKRLSELEELMHEVTRMRQTIERLLTANAMLEAKLKEVKK